MKKNRDRKYLDESYTAAAGQGNGWRFSISGPGLIVLVLIALLGMISISTSLVDLAKHSITESHSATVPTPYDRSP